MQIYTAQGGILTELKDFKLTNNVSLLHIPKTLHKKTDTKKILR